MPPLEATIFERSYLRLFGLSCLFKSSFFTTLDTAVAFWFKPPEVVFWDFFFWGFWVETIFPVVKLAPLKAWVLDNWSIWACINANGLPPLFIGYWEELSVSFFCPRLNDRPFWGWEIRPPPTGPLLILDLGTFMIYYELFNYCLIISGSIISLGLLEANPCYLLLDCYYWAEGFAEIAWAAAFFIAPGRSFELMIKLLMSIFTNPPCAWDGLVVWIGTAAVAVVYCTAVTSWVFTFFLFKPAVGADSAGLIKFLLITIEVVVAFAP